jgi:hypothetical protein
MANHSSKSPNTFVQRPKAEEYDPNSDPTLWLVAQHNLVIDEELLWDYKDRNSSCDFLNS